MNKVLLRIDGMHCSSCSIMIDMDLEEIAGVKSAKTSYVKALVEVEYDQSLVSENSLLESIKKSGYTASPTELKD